MECLDVVLDAVAKLDIIPPEAEGDLTNRPASVVDNTESAVHIFIKNAIHIKLLKQTVGPTRAREVQELLAKYNALAAKHGAEILRRNDAPAAARHVLWRCLSLRDNELAARTLRFVYRARTRLPVTFCDVVCSRCPR
ncbi:unnamed protein product [Fusarium graminearum]|uniref:Uncharacterized protein n=1 Tax=Gibberella zeae TaxID=5518 RepID=A0A8H3JRY7_GIBZA|nr:unnamed protein product [Fusarium graminearum]CAG2001121.1 unnamed protein product [Fusarium graminearum]